MGQLFDELKRRNVIRVAVAYVVAAWVILQAADLVLDNIGAPDWVMQAFMLALGLGFPLVVIFSWAFELTPEGIKRESDVDRSESVTHQTAKKLDQVTIGLLVLVVLFVFVERSFRPADVAVPDSTPAAAVSDKSIAVLAFEDLSQDGDQAYFADGLSEELLNLLAKVPDLQVAGRTSSFAFKGQHRDLREIGEILNVAHVLEGSVRKSGNSIRVTAQLVSTADGFHLFSETYDDELSDIFKVQDDIAQQITTALKAELMGEETPSEMTVTDPRTYELYLEARQKIHTRDAVQLQEASSLLDAALVIDPDYPPALAQKALAIALLSNSPGSYGDIPEEVAYAEAGKLVERALELDPELAEAHAVRGLILPWSSAQGEEALAHVQRALEINPNLDDASLWKATLLGRLGRDDEAKAMLERLIERDPLFHPALLNLLGEYNRRREFDKSTALVDRYERFEGSSGTVSTARANIASTQGRYADAIEAFRDALDKGMTSTVMRTNYGWALMALGEYEAMLQLGLEHVVAVAELMMEGSYDAAPVEAAYPPDVDIRYFSFHSNMYAATGNWQKILDLVENSFGGLDSLLEDFPLDGIDGLFYAPSVALAYRDDGRQPEFERLMRFMRNALDEQHERPTDPGSLWFGEATYAALNNNVDALLRACEELLALNEADVEAFIEPQFAPYRDDPRFARVVATLRDRANAERAKLGLPPFVPYLD